MVDIVLKNYFPNVRNYFVKPFGNGHINDTYKVELEESSATYILQRINKTIFLQPEVLIENHLKLQNEICKINHDFVIAKLIADSKGKNLYIDKDGNAWRMTSYINDSNSIEIVDETWQAYQSGLGFGWFVKATQSLQVKDFQEPIKNFHRLSFRLNQLKKAVFDDNAGRLKEVNHIVRFFEQREKSLIEIEQLIDKGEIPLRIVHNDTKINNILFNDKKAVAVIDLDTVGPGSILFDYGDALRTTANNAAEDEKKLEKVSFNLASFKAFTGGYLHHVKDILTDKEKIYLFRAPVLMTYIIGIRFLADYLNGDIYYKTAYPDHNLVRCNVQKKLIESMELHEDIMKKIIFENLKENNCKLT